LNSPDDFILYVFQGGAASSRQLPEAIKFCDRALEINPYPGLHLRGSMLQHGRPSGTITDFNEALRPSLTMLTPTANGFCPLSLEDYQAIADFNEALHFQPDYATPTLVGGLSR